MDPRINQPCFAINVQVVPDAAVAARICEVQERVLRHVDAELYRTPATALHISLFPLIWAREDRHENPRALWEHNREEWLATVVRACREITPFAVRLSDIVASATAIILAGSEPASVVGLRDRLEKFGRSIGAPVNRPAIVHSTLFRYLNAPDLRTVRSVLETMGPIDLEWPVDQISVRREKIYPSIVCEDLLGVRL